MFKKVVVPLDGSELAECSLAYVKKLAQSGSLGTVILLHVVEINPAWDERISGFHIDDWKAKMKAQSEHYLAYVKFQLQSAGISTSTESIEGIHPAKAISDYAEAVGADVIIVASHGYTGMARVIFGSVALRLLQISSVPVFFIRPESCQIPKGLSDIIPPRS